jgi:Asp-tRNA(Asn)/Glu-tRNA(Gln) amidotransferase A subunit family amidase
MDRRQWLAAITATGVGSSLFHRALAGLVHSRSAIDVTAEMIKSAEWVSGIEFTDEEREELAASLTRKSRELESLRSQELRFDDLPAVHFQPLAPPPPGPLALQRHLPATGGASDLTRPGSAEELAWLPVVELASLVKSGQVTSMELVEIYLERLKKFNPLLNCVVNLTEDLARKQARRADEEIAAGNYRGMLHGIPWGAKDLIAVPGYPTTWGIPQFRDRVINETATVAKRLEDAGAVLVAKLSLGAIAMGDKWFGGLTRSPWNYKLGSSGSSAGSASAAVAGLVGFTIGSETLGSIVSPSRRCGSTGFRPTFGRVSRAGCMSLSWTMDKIGPITRDARDCAAVFAAIHGADGLDPTATDRPFTWPLEMDFSKVRVGYTAPQSDPADDKQGDKDKARAQQRARENEESMQDLELLKKLGCQLVEVELPEEQNQWGLADVINIEAASVFDDMLRARQTEGWNTWPGSFRGAQFVSAIDYLRMMRRRRQLQFKMEELMKQVDFLVNCNDLLITNLTGHPAVVFPTGYRETGGDQKNRIPRSMLITGRLHDDDRLLALAVAVQGMIDAHRQHPPLDDELARKAADDAEEQSKAEADSKKEDPPSKADKDG